LKTDASRGVHKAPAGIGTNLSAVIAPYLDYNNTQQDALAVAGVNLLKVVPGSGVCVMGARTLAHGYPDRYVSVRRLLISLKSSLTSASRFAIFENNTEELWETVEDTLTTFLIAKFDVGALKGGSPEQSFYVVCDGTNNSQASIDAGVVNIEVGVALQHPAEFIVIRLGQTAGRSATATDSLEEA
jgi:phage tail sheath protein FI